ncbi:MAG TPA: beta-propeller fold lactonase family protein [Capsulimonadaceae bacterium]|nr:beta-propeller fold lactonase family protein [Capsulimonadaceae bacterium]
MKKLVFLLVIATIVALVNPVVAHAALIPAIATASGAVYVADNGIQKNSILAYQRATDGTLTFVHAYATGGRGSGGTIDPLQSQNSVLLSPDHRWLFVANSGSGDISVFKVHADATLKLADVKPSGGGFPVSLAMYGDWLYVLNAGGAGDVTGFTVRNSGELIRIPDSTQFLSATSAGGASIDFSPDGRELAATERLTNLIDVFPIGSDGAAGAPTFTSSHGAGLFSLTFSPQGALLTTETAGAGGSSAVSSYGLASDDTLQVITGSAPSGFAAACWIVVTSDGHFAYVSNAGSGEISEVGVGNDGTLTVFGSASSGAGSTPLDMALSQNNRFLYVVTAGNGRITAFRVEADGSLTALGTIDALTPASGQNGIAAF